jgi:acyl transferase domain-containing protein/acyl carrier protein
MTSNKEYNGLEIAIIGISGQFPGSENPRRYWDNLKNGNELIKFYTDDELRKTGIKEASLTDERYIKCFGVMDNKDCFDPSFFGYTADEAAMMDPQIRVFHEHCWKAIEDAGYASQIDKKKIGLFAGASANDTWKIYSFSKAASSSVDPFYQNMITAQNFISTLISYKLNLRGPSFYVDTACSTSLAAVHLACRSLLTRECNIALAGGVCITSRKSKGYLYKEGMIFSPDGHCRTFDALSGGTTAGEGTGVVVLKRLSEAIKDRDHIYAVIKSSSANNDGNNKVGYTAPGVKGQAECILNAHKLAGVDPRTISYVEAHGTATKLGDQIEIRALNEAFGIGGKDKFCAIGSVKTNIGHLDTAAGVAGLIKTVLSLKNKQIPASLHFKTPNPDLDFNGGPFYVNASLQEWKRTGDHPLRAGVNSLGIGGTNVHAVLEEAPVPEACDQGREYKLFTASAKTEASLTRYLQEFRQFLEETNSVNPADLAYTLQTGRKHFSCRKAISYKDNEELEELLRNDRLSEHFIRSGERNNAVVFMFTGQGSQYCDMGKDLYNSEPLIRKQMDEGFAILEKLTGEDFKAILFPEPGAADQISETRYAQPLLFLVEYALAQWLIALGIAPQSMIGHSIGEYVAACISGVFSFEDALHLVVKRGLLMNSLPPGDMLSIAITPEEARTYISDVVSLAAVNASEQVVLSGDMTAIAKLMSELDHKNIPYVKLRTSHAFHSVMQEPILESFRKTLEQVTFHRASLPFISNLTGEYITGEQAISSDYWVKHLRHTVQFSDGIKNILLNHKSPVFIEVGAGHSLCSLLKQQLQGKRSAVTVNLIRSAKEKDNDSHFLANSLGLLWEHGVNINWEAYYENEKRNRVSLPTYSFEQLRFPTEVNPFETGVLASLYTNGKTVNKELKDWVYYPHWKSSVLHNALTSTDKKTILLLAYNETFGQHLEAQLLGSGHTVITILSSAFYRELDDYHYAAAPEHFSQIVTALLHRNITVTDVIYGWGMAVDIDTLQATPGDQATGLVYFYLVKLVQAMLAADTLKGVSFTVVTNSLHKVTGNENIPFAQSLQLGLVNVLPQEYGITCTNLDVNLEEGLETVALYLATEINNPFGKKDRIVAIRYGQRWIQDYQKHESHIPQQPSRIKRGGVYLITGGLGNVGMVLAKHLLTQHEAIIILTGRKDIFTSNESGSLERYKILQTLAEKVSYHKVDVADGDAFRKLVEEVEENIGIINGVIHTAGIIDENYFQLVEDITEEKALAMFAPKVQGLQRLYEIFKDRHPDFVWITSSLSTVLGGLGFGSYAAANLFMDYFIRSKSATLSNWHCVGLAGMAFTEEDVKKSKHMLLPAEISALFEWNITMKGVPVIVENKVELSVRIQEVFEVKKTISLQDEPENQAVNKLARPDLSTAYVTPETAMEIKLKNMFETFFGIGNIGVEDNFFDLGGDSLKGMMLLKRIKKETGINLLLKDFFKYPSIRETAAKIDESIWLSTDVEMDNEITI